MARCARGVGAFRPVPSRAIEWRSGGRRARLRWAPDLSHQSLPRHVRLRRGRGVGAPAEPGGAAGAERSNGRSAHTREGIGGIPRRWVALAPARAAARVTSLPQTPDPPASQWSVIHAGQPELTWGWRHASPIRPSRWRAAARPSRPGGGGEWLRWWWRGILSFLPLYII